MDSINGILCFPPTCTGRLGGVGGSGAESKAGGNFRPTSVNGVLETGVLAVPLDRFDIVEMVEMVEVTDSADSRRCKGSVGLLGRAGEDWDEGARGGSFGGIVGVPGLVIICAVRVIVGGGSTPFLPRPFGSFPIPFLGPG